MNIRNLASSILLSVVAGGIGYSLSMVRNANLAYSCAHTISPLEDFESAASFSEIENSKSLLDAVCGQFIVELRTKWVPKLNTPTAGEKRVGGGPSWTTNRIDPVFEIKRKIEEFRGTEQEFKLLGELLTVLRWEKQHSQWLDTYLRLLYQHPTQPLVGQWVVRALEAGKVTGRDCDVMEALGHLKSIPIHFENKEIAAGVLAQMEMPNGAPHGSLAVKFMGPDL